MRTRAVIHTVGLIMLIEAGLLLIPAVTGLICHEQASFRAFLISALAAAAAGGLLSLVRTRGSNIYAREGFAIVGLSWIMLSLFGCLPFIISGQIRKIKFEHRMTSVIIQKIPKCLNLHYI